MKNLFAAVFIAFFAQSALATSMAPYWTNVMMLPSPQGKSMSLEINSLTNKLRVVSRVSNPSVKAIPVIKEVKYLVYKTAKGETFKVDRFQIGGCENDWRMIAPRHPMSSEASAALEVWCGPTNWMHPTQARDAFYRTETWGSPNYVLVAEAPVIEFEFVYSSETVKY